MLDMIRSFGLAKIGVLAGVVGLLSVSGGAPAAADSKASLAATDRAGSPHAVVGEFGGVNLPKGHQLLALQTSCQVCHSLDMVYTQRLSKATWTVEVTKMMKFGAPLPKSDKVAVIAYLTKYLGPGVPRPTDRATAIAPETTYSSAPAQ